MVGEDGVSHRDMASDALVESTVGKDAEGGSQVLLAVEALLLECVEDGVRPYPQLLSGSSSSKGASLLIFGRVLIIDV